MQRSIEQIYEDWRAKLKVPDDSIFWYHPSLDRIVLGLGMFGIAVRPLLPKLGKAESLKLFSIYIDDMVTAWIDDDAKMFEFPFETLMRLIERVQVVCAALAREHPKKMKVIEAYLHIFAYWVPLAGEIDERTAQKLLDDITIDGKTIDSDIISKMAVIIQPKVKRSGLDLDIRQAYSLFNDAYIRMTEWQKPFRDLR